MILAVALTSDVTLLWSRELIYAFVILTCHLSSFQLTVGNMHGTPGQGRHLRQY